jgi:tetratricopeptide (TPR) repeat protein
VPELVADADGASAAPATVTTDATQARFHLFDATAQFWKRAAAPAGVVLVLDDLHWADVTSLRLLEFIAAESAAARLMILGTYRDLEVDRRHPLSNTLAELARRPSFERIVLGGLSLDAAREIAGEIAGGIDSGTIDGAALKHLHAQTEGNPLYLAEMLRFHGGADATRGGARLPAGVRAAIGARLNRVSKACNAVLANAAVIGREFELGVLVAMDGESGEDACVAAIEEALVAGVVDELPDETDVYRFAHALIRETLYDEIAAIRRPRLHHRVGLAIEATYRHALPSQLSRLAFHFGAALPGQGAEKALLYRRRAGEQAMQLLAHDDAARRFGDALDALSVHERRAPPDTALRCELTIRHGEAQVFAADFARARDTLRAAADLAMVAGSGAQLARAAIAFEDASWRPGFSGEESIALLRAALQRIGEVDSRTSAQVQISLTRALIFSGALDEAIGASERAVETARQSGDPVVLARALTAAVPARWDPERITTRLQAAEEAIAIGQRIGDRGCVIEAAPWHLFDRMELGVDATFVAEHDAYVRLADELRQPFNIYTAAVPRPALALMAGDLDASERLAKEVLRLGERQPGLDASGVYATQMFTLKRERGELRSLAPVVRQFVAGTPAAGRWRPGLALVCAELDMHDDAAREFEALAANDFADVPYDAMWPAAMAYLAEVCTYLGDAQRAAVLHRKLAAFRNHNILAGTAVACFGAGSRFLGMLAATEGRRDDAARYFRHAIDFNARQGAHTWRAHAQAACARLTAPPDADQLLDSALATARQYGLKALEDRITTPSK